MKIESYVKDEKRENRKDILSRSFNYEREEKINEL